MKALHLLFIFFFASTIVVAQERSVTGTVTADDGTGPLPGVNILVKGTTQGTVTDIQGRYTINVPGPEATLVFSSVGFQTREVEVESRSTIDLELSADLQSLQEVVVVGYGEMQRENLTGSVETLDGNEIAQQPIMQTSQALQGKMAGVTVIPNSSQPGADNATIRIRGTGTLGNSNPLVLIDGVPGDMNGLDPKDIASMSVLKDAAAASIYGSRAANGVILITTKRGESGDFRVNYSGYAGWQQPTNFPEYLGGFEYMTYNNLARENLGQDPLYSQQFINDWQSNYQTNPDQYPNTDWINEVFTENGFQQHHHLSLSGGNEVARVVGSVSYMDQNGNVPGFNFQRYQARLNTDLTVTDKIGFNFDLNIRRSIREQPAGNLDDVIRQAYRIPPIFAARYSDGSWGPGWNGKNPVAIANVGGFDEDQFNYFRGILKAIYKPIEGMEVSVMYAPEYTDDFGRDFTRNYEVFNFQTGDLEYVFPGRNSLSQYNRRALTNNVNAITTYEKQINDHFFKGLLGYELITYRFDQFSAFRDEFPLQDYPQLNVGSRGNMQNGGNAEEWGLQSYFVRLNYDYKGRYLLEANIRRDGSSRFAEGNKYGVFPAFSAGWRVSEEPFMSGVNFISNLKLRASWGQLGNQNIGTYPFASVISLGNDFLFGGVPQNGAAQTDLANKDISWETTETTNFGLDLGLFANRFTMSAEYYIRNTSDILLQLPIPVTIGLNAPFQNAGVVRNEGWDLALGWNDNAGDFDYSINFNISDVNNEVINLVGTGPYINGFNLIREGDPINSIYGYQSIGYFQTEEEVDNAPRQFGALAPGDIRYANMLTEDSDGDGVADEADEVINSEDRVVIGNPFPRLTYGLNMSVGYKGFDLSVFAQGVGERDIFLRGDAVWAFQNAGKIQEWHLDYWTPENPDAAHPRLVATTNHNNYETSDFWVWSASYLRMRNLTFGYTFPSTLLEDKFVDNLRVYFSGQNLFTIDNMPQGIDPETPNGSVGAVYPLTAVYTFGVNIGF